MKKTRKWVLTLVLSIVSIFSLSAQKTLVNLEMLTVNENATTVITATEPIRFVDISTDFVAGDQPIENIIRLKPKEAAKDGDILAIVTIITERYRTQYSLVYTSRVQEAVTDKTIAIPEQQPYSNPAYTMSVGDMYSYAHRIYTTTPRFHDVATCAHKMEARVNNIYAIGEYFFIDFSITNRTNLRFDIDEIRVKLQDKKKVKATNSQIVELTPALILDNAKSFKTGYRNVIVIKKLTFPNNKILTIEMSEKQISGRHLQINIDYNDVLEADAFNEVLLHLE